MPNNTQPQLNELQQQLNNMLADNQAPMPTTPTPPVAPPAAPPVIKKAPPKPKPNGAPRVKAAKPKAAATAVARQPRIFVDEELTKIEAKKANPNKFTKKDLKYVTEAHTDLFTQNTKESRDSTAWIQKTRKVATTDKGKFSAKLLTPDTLAELKRREKRLADTKYFLKRDIKKALGV